MTAGKFITFEGGEGAGKSTQVKRLAETLGVSGIETVLTREPGGSPGAEDIRSLLVRGDVDRWSAMTEALLNYAARRDHLDKTILPALEGGRWVISDRFADSTTAYQGYGHGLERATLQQLHTVAVGSIKPDLTIILDIPVDAGLGRATAGIGGGEDRYERMEIEFHERLRQGFLEISEAEPERCAVIDAVGDEETVAARILDVVRERLGVSV